NKQHTNHNYCSHPLVALAASIALNSAVLMEQQSNKQIKQHTNHNHYSHPLVALAASIALNSAVLMEQQNNKQNKQHTNHKPQPLFSPISGPGCLHRLKQRGINVTTKQQTK